MATSLVGTGKMVGAQVRRVEDPRVLLGKSRYVDDIHLPGTVALAFVRSPYAHAITRVDVGAAQAHPGVLMARKSSVRLRRVSSWRTSSAKTLN